MKRLESGLATVEFAIVGAAALTVLIGCIEIGRMLFVWNSVGEATRRAARLAATCPMDDAAIKHVAMLNSLADSRDSSEFLSGLTSDMVTVNYLNVSGGAATGYSDVAFVRVAITGFAHQLFIPFISPTVNVPAFSTTVRTESLGYIPGMATRVCLTG